MHRSIFEKGRRDRSLRGNYGYKGGPVFSSDEEPLPELLFLLDSRMSRSRSAAPSVPSPPKFTATFAILACIQQDFVHLVRFRVQQVVALPTKAKRRHSLRS